MKTQGIINHFTWILDASSSMQGHTAAVIKLADTQISGLAERSKFHEQETRVTIYSFSDPGHHDGLMAKCLIWDMDVLRAPSISGLYRAYGNTALCDAVVEVIKDLQMIPEKHGDHSHVLQLLTDGQENWSGTAAITGLPRIISSLPGNWTLAGFVPDYYGRENLRRYGFPPGNIEVWDPSRKEAVEEVAVAMAAASDSYMTSRSAGHRSTTSLYSMKTPKAADLKKSLVPMTPGSYYFIPVEAQDLARVENGRIDQFMHLKTGELYTPGLAYYEMVKRERIQHYKKIAVAIFDKNTNTEEVYTGANARVMLGLPNDMSTEVRVSPGSFKGYRVFILSTSMNRKLAPGTRLLVMR